MESTLCDLHAEAIRQIGSVLFGTAAYVFIGMALASAVRRISV
jgi:hypothetical protein